MPYVVLAGRLAFQPVDPDNPTVPSGPEEIVVRGGFVPDYASTALVNGLSNAGLIVWAEQPPADVRPFEDIAEQPRSPEQPAFLPSNPVSPPPVLVDVEPVVEPEPDTQVPEPPKTGDSKETWENYAQLPAIGMTQAEAEGMSKAALMAEVKDRYARATA